jgi:hypothetical protein
MEKGCEPLQKLMEATMMSVTTEYKAAVLGMLYPQLLSTLAAGAQGGDVTGDDMIDFFALAIAAFIDHDTNLTTAKHLRLAADTAAIHIERRAKEFRAMQKEAGISWLTLKLEQAGMAPN